MMTDKRWLQHNPKAYMFTAPFDHRAFLWIVPESELRSRGETVVGVPIGTDEYAIKAKEGRADTQAKKLPGVPERQVAHLLLTQSLGQRIASIERLHRHRSFAGSMRVKQCRTVGF